MIISSNDKLLISNRDALYPTNEAVNRSYPALSLLEDDNRSYPLINKSDDLLTEEEATKLLDNLNDPFLEFLLNQNEEEETNIFDLLNTNTNENQNLVEAFTAQSNSETSIASLVFSDLYA